MSTLQILLSIFNDLHPSFFFCFYLLHFPFHVASRFMRYCLCGNTLDIEDEFHFGCVCPFFRNIRVQYLWKYYYVRPFMFKLFDLLSTNNRNILIHLWKYIQESLSLRNTILIRLTCFNYSYICVETFICKRNVFLCQQYCFFNINVHGGDF